MLRTRKGRKLKQKASRPGWVSNSVSLSLSVCSGAEGESQQPEDAVPTARPEEAGHPKPGSYLSRVCSVTQQAARVAHVYRMDGTVAYINRGC